MFSWKLRIARHHGSVSEVKAHVGHYLTTRAPRLRGVRECRGPDCDAWESPRPFALASLQHKPEIPQILVKYGEIWWNMVRCCCWVKFLVVRMVQKLPKSKFRKAVEGEKVLQAAYCLGTNCALPRQDTGQVLKLSLHRRNYLVPLHPWESPDLSGHSEPPGLLNQDSSRIQAYYLCNPVYSAKDARKYNTGTLIVAPKLMWSGHIKGCYPKTRSECFWTGEAQKNGHPEVRHLQTIIFISNYQRGHGTVMQLMLPPRSCHRASIADLAWRSATRRSTRIKMRRHVHRLHSLRYSDNVVRILARLLCFSCRYQDLQGPICCSPSLMGTIRLDMTWLLDHSVPPHHTKAQRRGGVDLIALRERTGSRVDLQMDHLDLVNV
jgi:hypothetical protein